MCCLDRRRPVGRRARSTLALRGLRWLLRLRSPRCGARRHVCCLGLRRLFRRRARSYARSTRAALASTLAVAAIRREAAHVCCLDQRRPVGRRARSTRAALASTLAVATIWREAARVLPRSAAAFPSPCSLYAGCAGCYACGRHGVARGGTCAALIGGGLWVAVLALRGLRWLVRLRSPRCGARRHVCCLDRRRPVCRRRCAVGCSLDAGCAGFYAVSILAVATLWRERLFARGRLESPRLTN